MYIHQPYRVENLYWSVDNPRSLSAHSKPCGMPVFVQFGFHGEHGKRAFGFYGTPILEYPGLIKVCIYINN